MYSPQVPLSPLAPPWGPREALAALLHGVSGFVSRLAARLARAEAPVAADPVLEFYAEAGAPEGALYLDGQLVGIVEGVTRL